ncbi:MAG: alpha-amylase family glycosyl hydrolase [Prevotellaceae bacterium]|nr:alpha-amylase family glycosyl hydrolase [Prevotellaceae bacterium]MDY2748932.1 alpha-amylase family glycosyl hydrolase [Prevotella sp.]
MNNKILIYQIFTRLFGNRNTTRKQWGTIAENGSGKFNDFDQKTLKHIKKMGFSHVWYTGVIRHATQTDYSQYGIPRQHPAVIKGRAGSPYAIADYYDVDPDLAENVDRRMKEFEALVARTHKAGMKVIIDFVPNHVARQYHSTEKPDNVSDLGADDISEHGFDPQNNFYYCPGCSFDPRFNLRTGAGKGDLGQDVPEEEYTEYPAKATGNDHFDNQPGQDDWYETVKLNYGVDYWTGIGHFEPIPDTWKKMTDILLFWAAKGVDGFRCDMAEMVPSAFWAWATEKVKYRYPEMIFIGEVYDPNQYRRYINAGFDYLYDKVGMYDTMRAAICGYGPARNITYAWQSTNDIKDNMLYFLENHDEQRVASDFFAGSARKGVPGLVASVLMQANPFMLYAGEEYGERGMDEEGFSGRDGRTTIFDYWSIDTLSRVSDLTAEELYIYQLHKKVLGIARKEKAIDGDFYDLMYVNPSSPRFNEYGQFAFLRKNGGEILLIVCNFIGNAVDIDVKIPAHAVEFLGIPEKNYKAKDLLSDDIMDISIKGDSVVKMLVPANSARIWKFSYRQTRK